MVVGGVVEIRIGIVEDRVKVASLLISNTILQIVAFSPTWKCPLGIGTLR